VLPLVGSANNNKNLLLTLIIYSFELEMAIGQEI